MFIATDPDESDAIQNYEDPLDKRGLYSPDVESYVYISHFVTMMKLTKETEALAVRLMDVAVEINITAKMNPAAIASVVTYMACKLAGEKKPLSEFYKVFGAPKASIRKYYRNMMDSLLITLKI